MNPILIARLRRNWPVLGALALLGVFALVHATMFRPLVDRYRGALQRAGAMGAVFDPGRAEPTMPPRVFALITDNSMPAADADRRSQSGALGAELLQDLSQAASRRNLDVVVTEPGQSSQLTEGVQVRANLRMRGRYADFVAFLDDLARSGRLVAVERFSIRPTPTGEDEIELQVARFLLKRKGARS